MYLLHWSEMENVQRYSGVFATCSIPASLTFGPYQGPLNMLLKTTDHKHLDFVLEVRLSDCYSISKYQAKLAWQSAPAVVASTSY